jgi:hypothetical protein
MLLATTVTSEVTRAPAPGWIAAALWLAAACLAWALFGRVRGTTLSAPAAWAIGSALALAVVEAALALRPGWSGTFGAALAHYAAAAASFCPPIAVLGAKRPQDRGWQWIVLSLWIVLLVPAGQAWAAHSGAELRLPFAWKFMLFALTIGGFLNYAFTRWTLTALIYASTQANLLIFGTVGNKNLNIAAPAALILVAVWQLRSHRRGSTLDTGTSLDQYTDRWLNFRDGWGSFWALRVKNRINETASLSNWPVRLEWGGFVASDSGPAPGIDGRLAAQIQQSMDSLLWRFERNDKPPVPAHADTVQKTH